MDFHSTKCNCPRLLHPLLSNKLKTSHNKTKYEQNEENERSRHSNSQFETCGHMQSLDFMAHKVFSANLSDEPKHEILACRNVPTITPCIRFRILVFQLYYLTVCSKYFYVHVSDDPNVYGVSQCISRKAWKGRKGESYMLCSEMPKERRSTGAHTTHARSSDCLQTPVKHSGRIINEYGILASIIFYVYDRFYEFCCTRDVCFGSMETLS